VTFLTFVYSEFSHISIDFHNPFTCQISDNLEKLLVVRDSITCCEVQRVLKSTRFLYTDTLFTDWTSSQRVFLSANCVF